MRSPSCSTRFTSACVTDELRILAEAGLRLPRGLERVLTRPRRRGRRTRLWENEVQLHGRAERPSGARTNVGGVGGTRHAEYAATPVPRHWTLAAIAGALRGPPLGEELRRRPRRPSPSSPVPPTPALERRPGRGTDWAVILLLLPAIFARSGSRSMGSVTDTEDGRRAARLRGQPGRRPRRPLSTHQHTGNWTDPRNLRGGAGTAGRRRRTRLRQRIHRGAARSRAARVATEVRSPPGPGRPDTLRRAVPGGLEALRDLAVESAGAHELPGEVAAERDGLDPGHRDRGRGGRSAGRSSPRPPDERERHQAEDAASPRSARELVGPRCPGVLDERRQPA